MNFDAEQKLRPELARGERLLWSGRPRQGLVLRGSDAFAIPFSLLWAGFACFWEYSVLSSGKAPLFFALWGLPFVAMGLYITVGRFVADTLLRARTWYGLSDQRVIILGGLFTREVKSLTLETLGAITLSERSDRGGSISFGHDGPGYARYAAGWPGGGRQRAPVFELSEDARGVYSRIRDAQQARMRTRADSPAA